MKSKGRKTENFRVVLWISEKGENTIIIVGLVWWTAENRSMYVLLSCGGKEQARESTDSSSSTAHRPRQIHAVSFFIIMSLNVFQPWWLVNQAISDSLGECPYWPHPGILSPHLHPLIVNQSPGRCPFARFCLLSQPWRGNALRPEGGGKKKDDSSYSSLTPPHRSNSTREAQSSMFHRLCHSEQLSYKSLFIGISSNLTSAELHLNQLREKRGGKRRRYPPQSPGEAAHNQLYLVKCCNRCLSEIIYSC